MSEHDIEPNDGLEPEADIDAPPARDPEIDAEARKYGWKPKEEFTLAPEGWKDADQFLDLTSIKYRREKDLRKESEKQIADLREQFGKIAQLTERQVKAREDEVRREYEAKFVEVQRAKEAAVETADLDGFKAAEAEQQRLLRAAPVPQRAPQEDHLSGVEWVKDNELRNLGAAMIDAQPHIRVLPPKDQVRWAEQQLRAVYPDRFTPAAQQAPQGQQHTASKVDGGGLAGGARTKGVDDLPADAKVAGREFVQRGIFKSMAEYAKSYHEQG